MSMSTYIIGLKPADEHWAKMKAIWDACEAAEICPPQEVLHYFSDGEPPGRGTVVDLADHPSVAPYNDDMREGFEVSIETLPPDVKIVRFYNSW